MMPRVAPFVLAGALFLTALIAAHPVQAQDYLSQFPSSNRVLEDWKDADSSQTALQQYAALSQLRSILIIMARGRSQQTKFTPAVAELARSYSLASMQVVVPRFDEAETRRLGMQSPSAKWMAERTQYETSKTFREQVLAKYFTPQFRAKFEPLAAAQDAHNAEANRMFWDASLRRHRDQEQRDRIPSWVLLGVYLALIAGWIIQRLTAAAGARGLGDCEKCGKPFSRAARACPHCGAARNARLDRQLPCRLCKTMLSEARHRVVSIGTIGYVTTPTTVSGTVIGNSVTATVNEGSSAPITGFIVKHAPCPQCGEPAPLRRTIDVGFVRGLWKNGTALLIFLVVPVLLVRWSLSGHSGLLAFGVWGLVWIGIEFVGRRLYLWPRWRRVGDLVEPY